MKLWSYLCWWFKTLISGRPHFVVGGDEPYLRRWYLIPRNPIANIYLHHFVRSDDDRALHNHPWYFVSVILKGGYLERLIRRGERGYLNYYRAGSILLRYPSDRHAVFLISDGRGNNRECWTLVCTGPKVQEWGFFCPQGFVPWDQFVDRTEHGNVGRGCE